MSETTKTLPPETTEAEILRTGKEACIKIIDAANNNLKQLEDPKARDAFLTDAIENMGMKWEGLSPSVQEHHRQRLEEMIEYKQTLVENAQAFVNGSVEPYDTAAMLELAVDKMTHEDPDGEDYQTAFKAFAYASLMEVNEQKP